jgi:hypothetical protein
MSAEAPGESLRAGPLNPAGAGQQGRPNLGFEQMFEFCLA